MGERRGKRITTASWYNSLLWICVINYIDGFVKWCISPEYQIRRIINQALIVLLNIWLIFLLLLLVPNSSANFFLYCMLQPCWVVSPLAASPFSSVFTSIKQTFFHSTISPVTRSTTAATYLLLSFDTSYAIWSSYTNYVSYPFHDDFFSSPPFVPFIFVYWRICIC